MRFEEEGDGSPDGARFDRRGAWRRRFFSAALILATLMFTAFLDGRHPLRRAPTDCGCVKRGDAAPTCCLPAVRRPGKRA